jgi:hypothetical protein
MPGKSRKKGKYTPQVKKQGAAVNASEIAPQTTATPVSAPAPAVKAPVTPPAAVKTGTTASVRTSAAPRATVSPAMLKSAALRFSNVKRELVTIGVLAAVILIIVIVVAMALS